MSPRLKKWDGHVPPVPHQIAPMVTVSIHDESTQSECISKMAVVSLTDVLEEEPFKQGFLTSSLNGAKSRLTNLLQGRTKEILTQVNCHILLYSKTKSFTQNIRGFIERLLRAAQSFLGAACSSQNSG